MPAIDAARRRPLAEYGRVPVKVPQKEREPKKRASWTYEPVTPENIAECEARARERLRDKPELIARLEALGRRCALTYKLLVLPGLRLNELRSLTVGDATLDGDKPYVTLRPEHERSRRGSTIVLRIDLARDLARHLAERLHEAQRDALRQRRPVPTHLSPDIPLLAVSRDFCASWAWTLWRRGWPGGSAGRTATAGRAGRSTRATHAVTPATSTRSAPRSIRFWRRRACL